MKHPMQILTGKNKIKNNNKKKTKHIRDDKYQALSVSSAIVVQDPWDYKIIKCNIVLDTIW